MRAPVLVLVLVLIMRVAMRRRATIGEFKKAYPDAKLIAVQEAVEKKKKEGLTFDGGGRHTLPRHV